MSYYAAYFARGVWGEWQAHRQRCRSNTRRLLVLAFLAGFVLAMLLVSIGPARLEQISEAEIEARIAVEVAQRVSIIVDSMAGAMPNCVNKAEVENVIH